MMDVSLRYRLKVNYIFLYEGDFVYIYNHKDERVVLRVKLNQEFISALKKIDGVKTLKEVATGLDEHTTNQLMILIQKYLNIYFEVCELNSLNESIVNYSIKNFIYHHAGAFKLPPFEMIRLIKQSVFDAHIMLIGCGVLGNEILHSLLEMGIKNYILVDSKKVGTFDAKWSYFFDCKSPMQDRKTNIYDNVQKRYSDVQLQSVDDCEGYLSTLRVEDKQKIFSIVCEDEVQTEDLYHYNQLFHKSNIKWTSIYVDSEKIAIGPTIIPKVTGCLNCKAGSYEAPVYNGFNTVQLYSFQLAASLLAHDIYNHLSDQEEYLIKDISLTLGKQFVIKFFGLNGYSNELLIDPHCNCLK
ncbi:MAG: hypothetical protein K0R00_1755 [Herbinix sp.]|jgi:hypothetical protein|nr:hypothetical protein [Herbinix sp.]